MIDLIRCNYCALVIYVQRQCSVLLQEVMRRSYIKVKSSLRMNVIRHLQHVSHWQSELTRPVCPVGSVKYQRSVPKQEKVPDRLVEFISIHFPSYCIHNLFLT